MKSSSWTPVLILLGLAAIMTPAILLAASGSEEGFDAIVRTVEVRYHAHAHRIPFLGLISVVAGVSTHGGVHNLHLAEFENLDTSNHPVSGEELNTIVQQHVGPGWERIVRETSRDGSEQNLIFVHPEGNHLGMLVVDLQGSELDLVQLSINPDQLTHELNERSGKHNHHVTSEDEKPGSETPETIKPEAEKPNASVSE